MPPSRPLIFRAEAGDELGRLACEPELRGGPGIKTPEAFPSEIKHGHNFSG